MKRCTKCSIKKTISEFHKDVSKEDKLHPVCAECHSKRNKMKRLTDPEFVRKCRERSNKYRKEHPEEFKRGVRNSTLKAKYGIGIKQYEEILLKQKYGCAVCGRKDSGVGFKNLHVDHSHLTGKIRGLLCQPCNVSLGKMNNNPTLLRKLADYLEEN